jgi:hypothetical protein
MASESGMKRLCDAYIRKPCTIGLIYGIIPPLIWLVFSCTVLEFRQVYLLRAVIALVIGGVLGAGLNRFGLMLWLTKHRSTEGPASVLDGTLIGAAIGCGMNILPPLTSLISSNHPEQAKTFIICSWLAACVIGGLMGTVLAVFGRAHVERPAAGGGR